MSRVAKKPITLTKGVECTVSGDVVTVKGPKGTLTTARPANVDLKIDNGIVTLGATDDHMAMAGTLRALLNNMVTGVASGFERKLELVGVGYRAAMQGKDLNLSLGFSHPVVFTAPAGITIEPPTLDQVVKHRGPNPTHAKHARVIARHHRTGNVAMHQQPQEQHYTWNRRRPQSQKGRDRQGRTLFELPKPRKDQHR